MASVKYLHSYRDRHGRLRHAFRRRGFKTIMLPGVPDSVELMQAYTNALAGADIAAPRVEVGASRNKPGSVSAAVTLYLGSMDFGRLAEATRGNRRRDLERFRADFGEQSFGALERKHVELILAAKASTPHAAKNFLKALRGVVVVALRAGLCETDPTRPCAGGSPRRGARPARSPRSAVMRHCRRLLDTRKPPINAGWRSTR
jgi:hypothetical protein